MAPQQNANSITIPRVMVLVAWGVAFMVFS
jgi:hypothetical protein